MYSWASNGAMSVAFFAGADEADGDLQLVGDGEDDPPFDVLSSLASTIPVTSTASAKAFACISPFWPVISVDHEDDLVRRVLVPGLGDLADLAQLLHQVELCVQAAGGVDDHDIRMTRPRRLQRVVDDGTGVGCGRPAITSTPTR
jgi:hypothetical protein